MQFYCWSDSSDASDVAELQLRQELEDELKPVLINRMLQNKQVIAEGKPVKHVYILEQGTAFAYYKRALADYNKHPRTSHYDMGRLTFRSVQFFLPF